MYQLQVFDVYLLSIHKKTTVNVSASVSKVKHPGAESLIHSPFEKNQSKYVMYSDLRCELPVLLCYMGMGKRQVFRRARKIVKKRLLDSSYLSVSPISFVISVRLSY